MKKLILSFSLFLGFLNIQSQSKNEFFTKYRATIKRNDGLKIVFNIQESIKKGKINWIISNAKERLIVDDIQIRNDSIFVELPFFEASFQLKKSQAGYNGLWKKATSSAFQFMPIEIVKSKQRILMDGGMMKRNLTGRWKASFLESDGSKSIAVAEFNQLGNKITGTILTPSGDYRFLEGTAAADSICLTTFDGSHAFLFSAKLSVEGQLINGIFVSGPTFKQSWTALRDSKASIDEEDAIMQVKPGKNKLSFRFPDLDSQFVSIDDARFKDKVVIVQIMGSWCPNCMDETAFLSKFYDANKSRGVEVVGLAYEYSNDFQRSRKSLMKFHDKFQVKYPFLITGITTTDPMRTEKTLPEMTPIKAFPSMIILGKDGSIRKTHAGYSGPATGKHFEDFQKEFKSLIDKLLAED